MNDGKQEMATTLGTSCFKYLDFIDVPHSIRLSVNFENIDQPLFDQCCKLISSNEEIFTQIHSLYLSNENTCWQIQPFLSRFSLDRFIHLQSLTLKAVTEDNLELIRSTLPYLEQLTSFNYTDFDTQSDAIISVLPTSKLKTLSIPTLPNSIADIDRFSSLENLTVSSCNQNQLTSIWKSASRLKHLQISTWSHLSFTEDIFAKLSYVDDAIHLTHLTIEHFPYDNDTLRTIFKQTPNLTYLKIDVFYGDNAIRASVWENIIRLYLLHLIHFQFVFSCDRHMESRCIEMGFEEFRGQFWVEQHHWRTEYVISNRSARIYTTPYISKMYRIERGASTHCNSTTNDTDKFDNISDLAIDVDALAEGAYPSYFSRITSLCLSNTQLMETDSIMKRTQLESLKATVNLLNVTSLNMTSASRSIKPSMLLYLLKEAQQISSLTIDREYLKYLFQNDGLCEHLTRTILKLEVSCNGKSLVNNLSQLKRFCQTFSSIRHLTCMNDNEEFILYLFKHLSQLILLNLRSLNDFNSMWLKDCLQELGNVEFVKSSEEIKIYLFRKYQT
ncbi:unnamed protein product [Adineta ricciae]|uniref:Uncharacterized protein n=1 Tax=Adineta ricciae TaxID=249248 RepID=A0A814K9B3_ADIRI|nr:unnamed protein product [Adineta ricciae]CAF1516427.1 unnamed protein product [Adineta ricciae]